MPVLLDQLPPPPAGRSGWPWTSAPAASFTTDRSWPRISIVTPSFNQAAYLEETIRSVLLQGYPNLNYIVIDGGSTDGSVDILEKYSAWLDHWESERDRGQSHAITKGLARCDGDWFNWLNSDDYLFPGALHSLATCAIHQPGALIVAGRTRNLHEDGLRGSYGCRLGGPGHAALFSLAINQPGALLNLSAVREAGIPEQLHYTMDLALWLRVLLRGNLVTIEDELAVYRYHAGSKTCSGADVFALEEYAVLHDLFRALAPSARIDGLSDVRSLCKAPRLDFAVPPAPDECAASRAFLDRLLVTDSLAFRSLRRAMKDDRQALVAFSGLLDRLRPALASFYGAKAAGTEGRALVHALQETGRITSWSAALRAFRSSPSLPTLRALLRLWLKS